MKRLAGRLLALTIAVSALVPFAPAAFSPLAQIANAATCTSSVGPGIPPPASVSSGIPGFHAAWYGQSGYMTLCPGDTSTATVAIYNSGSRGWVRGVMGEVAYLGTWDPNPGQDQPSMFGGDGTNGSPSTGWPRYNRVAVQPASYVGPNQVAWFQFGVRAPTVPGTYRLYIRPLIEGARWMEDYGIFWQITVPDAQPAEQYGLLTRRGENIIVRTETDVTPIRSLAVVGFGDLAMRERAPDGRRIAYWTEAAGTAELHVHEVPTGADRVIARFPNLQPGGIAWSTDGSGILVSVGPPQQQSRIARTLIAVNATTLPPGALGGIREVYQTTGPSGASVMPLFWRTAPEIFGAYETGPGGFNFGYTVIRPGMPVMKWEPDGQAGAMQASHDASQALGLWLERPAIRVWPVEHFTKYVERSVSSPEQVAQPRWWPRLPEVVYERGTRDSVGWRDIRIERWDPVTGTVTRVKEVPPKNALGGYFVRVDGSGLITQRSDGGWELTDLRSEQTAPVPLVAGEQIIGSVVLR